MGCTESPKGLGKAEFQSGRIALESIGRAEEYAKSGILLYEPRHLEAQKALVEAKHNAGNSESDQQVIGLLDSYLNRIELDRIFLEGEDTIEHLARNEGELEAQAAANHHAVKKKTAVSSSVVLKGKRSLTLSRKELISLPFIPTPELFYHERPQTSAIESAKSCAIGGFFFVRGEKASLL